VNDTPATTSPLVTLKEAAALCRLSVRSFERHIRSALTQAEPKYPVRFFRTEVLAWLDRPKAGSSELQPPSRPTTPSAFAGPVKTTSAAAERLTPAELRRRLRASTQASLRPRVENPLRLVKAAGNSRGR
jgi:hypothetical protein